MIPENDPGDEPIAAVDLGSNSFHMVIARVIDAEVSILDRIRDPVRLAAGLDEDANLSPETVARMETSLRRFHQRLEDVPRTRVRAIGTNTFRRAKTPPDLVVRAGEALGSPIEILAGPEEARLIYLGVAHDQPAMVGRRLVVDIGGGSTECILGEGFQPIYLHSLDMGCVGYSRRFFGNGKLKRNAFEAAEMAARLEMESIQGSFRDRGWADAIGSSGTVNALSEILRANQITDGAITQPGLAELRKLLISAKKLDQLVLHGLQADRRPVIAGGLAILQGVFGSLGIESMTPSKAALREGLLYDLLGRIRNEDVRDRTIRALSERYRVDNAQASRVEDVAMRCFEQVALDWELDVVHDAQLLSWAARLHEIGLAMAFAGHHHHGAYIVQNSTMPGFSRSEQVELSALVREHRRKLSIDTLKPLHPRRRRSVLRLCVLLRLAVRLNRVRSTWALPDFTVRGKEGVLEISFPPGWLEAHPLTRADLEDENLILSRSNFRLRIV
jgi:exopolyphosphatase/guanosine-5'-triphosphate,3'-diphosphate pyrophosphatase